MPSVDTSTDQPKTTVTDTRPNLLVIGAASSGTTALCATLARHPEIFMITPNQVHFLANAGRPVTFSGPGDDLSINRALVSDPDHYRRLFDHAGHSPLRGEGSVSTLYAPDRAIPAITANAAPDVRLIAILRNPVKRAYSSYLDLRSRGVETSPTFEHALDLEDGRIADGYHHLWHLRAMSRYRDQIAPFATAFGDRLLVLIHEEYERDPKANLDRVHRFLGLDPLLPLQHAGETRRGDNAGSDLLVSVVNGIKRAPMAQQLVRAATPRALRGRNRRAKAERPPLDPVTEATLIADFRPDVAAVEQVLGRTIDDWRRR